MAGHFVEPADARERGYEFEHLSLAIAAAASGLGLCVTPEHLVQDDIATGRLIAPLGFRASGYTYVAWAHGRRKRKPDAFIDWMRQDILVRQCPERPRDRCFVLPLSGRAGKDPLWRPPCNVRMALNMRERTDP